MNHVIAHSWDCWQNSVPCGLSDWHVSSLWTNVYSLHVVSCHLGFSIEYLTAWHLASSESASKKARESTSKTKGVSKIEDVIFCNVITEMTFQYLYHILLVKSKLLGSCHTKEEWIPWSLRAMLKLLTIVCLSIIIFLWNSLVFFWRRYLKTLTPHH